MRDRDGVDPQKYEVYCELIKFAPKRIEGDSEKATIVSEPLLGGREVAARGCIGPCPWMGMNDTKMYQVIQDGGRRGGRIIECARVKPKTSKEGKIIGASLRTDGKLMVWEKATPEEMEREEKEEEARRRFCRGW